MKVRATISWDSSIEFKAANLVDIVLSFENGEREEFKGQLKNPETVIDYLGSMVYYASNHKQFKIGNPVKKSKGQRVYEVPVAPDTNIADLKYCADRIQKKYYIVSRDESVTDEEYCTFFGSSGNLWDSGRCPYSRGDFVETLRQTVYDMEHGSPKIYKWTNVPKMWGMDKKIASDPQLKEFFLREINPLLETFSKIKKASEDDVEGLKDIFIRIADVAERYKKEHNIERL